MIIVDGEVLLKKPKPKCAYPLLFRLVDNEVHSAIPVPGIENKIPGSLLIKEAAGNFDIGKIGKEEDQVRVVITRGKVRRKQRPGGSGAKDGYATDGYILKNNVWVHDPVIVTPVKTDLFSRSRGIFETDLVADQCIYIIGLGSVGGPVATELGRLGVNLVLMDPDRIDLHNVVRNPPGLSDIGRHKVKYYREVILDTNPSASVEIHAVKACWENRDLIRENVRKCDFTAYLADDGEGREITNKICMEENKPILAAGAFRRAYGCQILIARQPGISPCLQCFKMTLPDQAFDQEISNEEQAERLAYSDRPVPIEPGLSNDIAPVNQMVVKLILQELLKGKKTTLRSLDEDLVAPWYLWLNRREAETQYAKLKPLEFGMDGMRILRWYGVDFERNTHCPACGDFEESIAEAEGIEITPEDIARFTQG